MFPCSCAKANHIHIHIHIHTMQEPATAPWGLRISNSDFTKLRAGFEPQDQDDKWRISVFDQGRSQSQSPNGNISIHVTRVVGNREIYVLFVNPNNGDSSSSSVMIEAITWEQNKGGIRLSEEQAKKEVVMITRSMLQCDYDALPEYDPEDMFNHPGARIGSK